MVCSVLRDLLAQRSVNTGAVFSTLHIIDQFSH